MVTIGYNTLQSSDTDVTIVTYTKHNIDNTDDTDDTDSTYDTDNIDDSDSTDDTHDTDNTDGTDDTYNTHGTDNTVQTQTLSPSFIFRCKSSSERLRQGLRNMPERSGNTWDSQVGREEEKKR